MSLSIENLFKARDFVDLKNISGEHIELTFKNPIVAMLAKGKIQEIAEQCSPDSAFNSCELKGNVPNITSNPEFVSERFFWKILVVSVAGANFAPRDLLIYIADRMKAYFRKNY